MKKEKAKFLSSLTLAFAWVALLWLVKGAEWAFDLPLREWGIFPRYLQGMPGIITAPFIHGGVMDHLLSNSLSLFPLALTLFYFYRPIAWRVIVALHLIVGAWVWIAARSSVHIGASGVIYGLAFFLFFSGIFRKDLVAMAVALVVVFFHGSMVWGTLPFFTEDNISWESHLFGALAGILTAFFWRKEGGPPRKKYSWDIEAPRANPQSIEAWDYKSMYPPPDGFEHPE